jgi:hypothetical protein
MRFHWTCAAAVCLAAVVSCCQPLSTQAAPSHLQALAARQELRDMVCYALADGSVNRAERRTLLLEAKEVLSADEYGKFKQWLDQIAPPPKPSPKEAAKIAARNRAIALAKQQAEQQRLAQRPAVPDAGPAIPAGAVQPDEVAQPTFLR